MEVTDGGDGDLDAPEEEAVACVGILDGDAVVDGDPVVDGGAAVDGDAVAAAGVVVDKDVDEGVIVNEDLVTDKVVVADQDVLADKDVVADEAVVVVDEDVVVDGDVMEGDVVEEVAAEDHQVVEQVIDGYCDDDAIKLEFEEEVVDFNEERDFHAQALMTLHQSVQNLPKKHKTGLQEAVREASPIKRARTDDGGGFIHLSSSTSPHHPHISTMEMPTISHLRFDPNNSRATTPTTNNNYDPTATTFSLTHTRTMKGLYNKIANLLKLTSARRWVYHEWFYSNIDRSLILGQTDFESCLQQLFSNLKTRTLTKSHWTLIRRLMGKPRRCSPAFFAEERVALEEKRKKIRYLHQLKGFEVKDMTQFKDLPEEIPMPMVIGTKVTAKVHPEGDGLNLFTGTVDAVDNVNNAYRINFDRVGIGTHSIPDVEVASEDYEAMNLQLFVVKERPKIARPNSPTETYAIAQRTQRYQHAMASSKGLAEAINDDMSGTFGGFPIKFLLYMTRLSKTIALKKKYVDKLKELNGKAELLKPLKQVKKEFQKQYAFVILELEKINLELDSIFQGIHNFVRNDAPQLGLFDETTTSRTQCNETAALLVEQSNRIVKSEKMRELVTRFTSLMLQITRFSEGSHGAFELSSIDEAVQEIKKSLDDSNKKLFEDRIETGIAFIKNGLQDGGTMLDAFTNNNNSTSEGEKGNRTTNNNNTINNNNNSVMGNTSSIEGGRGVGMVNGVVEIGDDDDEDMMEDDMDDEEEEEEEEEEEDDMEELEEDVEGMDTGSSGGKFELLA